MPRWAPVQAFRGQIAFYLATVLIAGTTQPEAPRQQLEPEIAGIKHPKL